MMLFGILNAVQYREDIVEILLSSFANRDCTGCSKFMTMLPVAKGCFSGKDASGEEEHHLETTRDSLRRSNKNRRRCLEKWTFRIHFKSGKSVENVTLRCKQTTLKVLLNK
ncbi:hypothetical protein AVEN_232794-1 [Araneus ventricosus]|uniref:Uncharacterized protein n=1 Tax=Araneus ventricosus TaxID=182803 RepID=A0A4Y2U0Z2_ARAVE|nr:hypothetical protein AVEN_232794-1 [Araneus ventricosus]